MSNYFATYIQDLEQDPFDPTDFVERLAWRLTGGGEGGGPIDPVDLHRCFEEEISSLQMITDQYQGKIQRLQNQCREDEEEFNVTLDRLQRENQTAFEKLTTLNEKIQAVAAKVVHLGDQLENVSAPRARAFEAFQLMQHFNEFMSDQPLESDIFTDPDRLLESAEMIYKLSQITQELSSDKFSQVQSRIAFKYDEIERLMIEEFKRTQRMGNRGKMKQIAEILSNFKGYSQCLDAYVEHLQISSFRTENVFMDTVQLCQKAHPSVKEIFPSPEQVMAKLVLNVFHGKLQEYIKSKIDDYDRDPEGYLSNLYDLYSRTKRLADDLAEFRIGSDRNFLPTLIRSLFAGHLDTYIARETAFLNEQCSLLLRRYYEGKGHQKRIIQSGGMAEIKRDITARIMTPESFGGETFISEEVAINILQETKQAFQRCQLLSTSGELPTNVQAILDILVHHLVKEHLDYAVELGLQSIPLSEMRVPPSSHFFTVVRQSAAICHLLEKQFEDSILPLVKGTQKQESCVSKKRMSLYSLENKLSNGLDRQLSAIASYTRFLLSLEMKKIDYKQEMAPQNLMPELCSPGCEATLRFLKEQVSRIRDSLDGGNLNVTLGELGVRFHRVLLDQIYQFQYTTNGAMRLICDLNEYKRMVGEWKNSLASRLFDLTHRLSGLLVLLPENLSDSCSTEFLNEVDRSIIVNFVALRTDYRTSKLCEEFR